MNASGIAAMCEQFVDSDDMEVGLYFVSLLFRTRLCLFGWKTVNGWFFVLFYLFQLTAFVSGRLMKKKGIERQWNAKQWTRRPVEEHHGGMAVFSTATCCPQLVNTRCDI